MWISVKDRLPEPMVMVLVVDQDYARLDLYGRKFDSSVYREVGVRFGYLCSVGFRTEGTNGKCKITHWQPLPEPPNET